MRAQVLAGCEEQRQYVPLCHDTRPTARAMLATASTDLAALLSWERAASPAGPQWNAIFRLGYDILHALAEAMLLMDRVKARTHECLFARLCESHPELGLEWAFLDSLRVRRNRSAYYGEGLTYADWRKARRGILRAIIVLRRSAGRRL